MFKLSREFFYNSGMGTFIITKPILCHNLHLRPAHLGFIQDRRTIVERIKHARRAQQISKSLPRRGIIHRNHAQTLCLGNDPPPAALVHEATINITRPTITIKEAGIQPGGAQQRSPGEELRHEGEYHIPFVISKIPTIQSRIEQDPADDITDAKRISGNDFGINNHGVFP